MDRCTRPSRYSAMTRSSDADIKYLLSASNCSPSSRVSGFSERALAHSARRGSPTGCRRTARRRPREHPPRNHEHGAEGEEGNVPPDRPTEVVAHVMDAEQLMVDDPLHEVEGAPAHQQQTELEPVRRRDPA